MRANYAAVLWAAQRVLPVRLSVRPHGLLIRKRKVVENGGSRDMRHCAEVSDVR